MRNSELSEASLRNPVRPSLIKKMGKKEIPGPDGYGRLAMYTPIQYSRRDSAELHTPQPPTDRSHLGNNQETDRAHGRLISDTPILDPQASSRPLVLDFTPRSGEIDKADTKSTGWQIARNRLKDIIQIARYFSINRSEKAQIIALFSGHEESEEIISFDSPFMNYCMLILEFIRSVCLIAIFFMVPFQ